MLHHVSVAVMGLTAALAASAASPVRATTPVTSTATQVQNPTVAPAAVAAIDQEALLARIERAERSFIVLDVRTAEEFAAGHVPGARNISHDVLGERLDELADVRDREVIVYCRSGRRSGIALELLRAAGFPRLAHLTGDWLAWEAAGRPVEKPRAPAVSEGPPLKTPERQDPQGR